MATEIRTTRREEGDMDRAVDPAGVRAQLVGALDRIREALDVMLAAWDAGRPVCVVFNMVTLRRPDEPEDTETPGRTLMFGPDEMTAAAVAELRQAHAEFLMRQLERALAGLEGRQK